MPAPAKGMARGSDAFRDELLSRLLRLKSKKAQAKFLTRYPNLIDGEIVSWLTELVRKWARVNTGPTITLAEIAVAIAGKLGHPSAIAQSLRAMGNALYVTGQNKSAVRSHQKACEIFRKLGSTYDLARTLNASIQPLILTGQYDRAFAAASEARSIFVGVNDEGRLARVELNLGNIFHRLDRFAEALECYERAVGFFRDNPEQDPEALAVAMHNVAMCLVGLNDFPRALVSYREARQFAVAHGMQLLVTQSDYNIASLFYFQGDHSRAIEMLRATRDESRKVNDRYHVGLCELDLSEIYLEVNQSKKAEEAARQAGSDFQRLEMGYETGKALANLALALWQQGGAEPALELFAKARSVFVRENNRVWPSRMDLYRAIILIERGQPAEAKRLCQTALKAFRKARVSYSLIQCHLLLTHIYLQAGKAHLAYGHCMSALRRLHEIDLPVLRSQAYHLMGRIQVARARPEEAHISYEQARRTLEELRGALSREELRISFMKNRLVVYEELVELCLAGKTEQRRDEAFQHMEQSKSRSLRDLMSNAGSEFHLTSSLDPSLISRVRDLRAEIHWYSRKYEEEQLGETKSPPERSASIQSEIRKREDELLHVAREMPIPIAESAGLISLNAVTVEEMRGSLGSGSTLLEYFQIRDQLVAVVLDQGSLEVVPVTTLSRVDDLMSRLNFQLSKFKLSTDYVETFGKPLMEATLGHARDLYDAVLGPIITKLNGNHLLIVPHGSLHALPFHALFDGSQFLIDRFKISYAPSATVFRLCQQRSTNRSGKSLVLGVPDAAAPLVLDEVQSVSAALPQSELFLGAAVTADLLRTKGEVSRIIHIATHGYFRQDNPMFSGIRLGDGVLSLYDLYQMRLPAELITLSGCATGLNVVADGDELLGLVRGLIYAGAQSALLTLWDVPDRSTSEFMASFYRHLSYRHDKPAALRLAMIDLRDRYPHPYHWAPFVLVGKVT
jgi:CHAT domain-containing protein